MGPGPRSQVLSISPLGDVVTPDPSPSGKRVQDRWSGEMESSTTPRTTATTGVIPHSVLPTVFEHCTPAIQGEDDDFNDPLCMYTVPPCVYKRMGRAFPGGSAHSVGHNASYY